MIKQNEDYTDDVLEDMTVYRMKLWATKLRRLDDEMLIHVIQSATHLLNLRHESRNLKQFNKENN